MYKEHKKAWQDAKLYVMHKNGISTKNPEIMKTLIVTWQ